MFGAEALAKKYGEEPPPLWIEEISAIPDYKLDRGLRRLRHSGAQHIPTLPQFTKLCNDVGGQGEYDNDPAPGFERPRLPERQWSKWEIEGNLKLLAHVRNMGKSCHPDSSMGLDGRVIPGPIGTRITNRLVQAKNAWVEDMTADDPGNGINRQVQLDAWNDVIGKAMADIASWKLTP